jgi:uncharacterized SAM-binding protein YcdF (DUF218 family)
MKELVIYLFGLPGIFFVVFLIMCAALFTGRYGRARTFAVVLAVLVLVFSNVATGKFLASFLIDNVTFKQVASIEEIDLVVMPSQGIEFNGSVLGWMPSPESFKAANVAYDLQARLVDRKVPMLICGGKMEGNQTDLAESEVIKSYFNRKTAQIRKTLTEDISKNLYEQVWQCTNMIKHYGSKNPVLVIDELKMLRTLALFRARGVEMIPVPVFVIPDNRSAWFNFLPSVEGLMLNRSVLIEYFELALDFMNQRVTTDYLSYKK